MNNNKIKFNKFINNLFDENLNDDEVIQSIINYNKENQINIRWLYNKKNKFYNSSRQLLLHEIKQVLQNELYNYYDYVNYVKNIIFSVINDEEIIFKKNFLLNKQIKYVKDHIAFNILPIKRIYNIKEFEKLNYEDKKIEYRDYKSMENKMGYNSLLIYYSYICYFKSAVNSIIHHPIFKSILNISSDSLKLINGGYYKINLFYQIGGSQLWDKLQNEENIIDIIELYNILTNHSYLIGTPGIKYYPHQILQELLFFINNDFSKNFYCNYQFIYVIAKLRNNINILIENKLKSCNLPSLFIAPITNNPFDCYMINKIQEKQLKMNELFDYSQNKISKNIKENKIYHYNYIVNDYYLQSFCIVENIPKKHLTFHCVYIQLLYDDNMNVIDKIRYDGHKEHYLNNKLDYIQLENEKIFNDNGINDYYDGEYNYKICLLCYVKNN